MFVPDIAFARELPRLARSNIHPRDLVAVLRRDRENDAAVIRSETMRFIKYAVIAEGREGPDILQYGR